MPEMRKTILFAVLLISVMPVYGQDNVADATRPANNINLSLLGDVSLIGINYERVFFLRPHMALTARAGTGFFSDLRIFASDPDKRYVTFPHHFSVLFGRGRHFFETGIGATFLAGYTESASAKYIPYPLVAYRFLPLKAQNVNLRVSLPLFMQIKTDRWNSGGGSGKVVARTSTFSIPGIALGISF